MSKTKANTNFILHYSSMGRISDWQDLNHMTLDSLSFNSICY